MVLIYGNKEILDTQNNILENFLTFLLPNRYFNNFVTKISIGELISHKYINDKDAFITFIIYTKYGWNSSLAKPLSEKCN